MFDSSTLRQLANETREVAETMNDPASRNLMVEAAARFDAIAGRAEALPAPPRAIAR